MRRSDTPRGDVVGVANGSQSTGRATIMAERGGEGAEKEAAVRSTSVSLLTYSGGGRLRKSPTPSKTRIRLDLTRERLEYREQDQQQEPFRFILEDLVGVDIRNKPPTHDKNACQMNVHFYPKRTEKKKTVRKMNVVSLCFDSAETFSENRAEASNWKNDIKLYSHYRRSDVLGTEGESTSYPKIVKFLK